ncbi:hypothetical protein GCM10010347_24770 [Streptomyces cirratus]|uniref:Uncharacterized protein n=1 Tax=Streptomyces cirratus TaxID=68187 RepID=A0ABQ3ET74_9ACTN|nr:hypothetical protein GCM10010347_24770 [Streptomyces cirratus]
MPGREVGRLPGAVVDAHLDPVDAPVLRPGDSGDHDRAGCGAGEGPAGVDAGLRLDGCPAGPLPPHGGRTPASLRRSAGRTPRAYSSAAPARVPTRDGRASAGPPESGRVTTAAPPTAVTGPASGRTAADTSSAAAGAA